MGDVKAELVQDTTGRTDATTIKVAKIQKRMNGQDKTTVACTFLAVLVVVSIIAALTLTAWHGKERDSNLGKACIDAGMVWGKQPGRSNFTCTPR